MKPRAGLAHFKQSMIQICFDKMETVLCLGAHSDIEIGCGATIWKLTRERPGIAVWWVVFTADGKRKAEAKETGLGKRL